jgi:Uma2 family endonuclease
MTAILNLVPLAEPAEMEKVSEEIVYYVPDTPMTFEQYVERFGKADYFELVDGMVVEKPMVQLDHEKLLVWLLTLCHNLCEEKALGIVLGSRTPVRINPYRGCLPDFLFVRQDNISIVERKGIYGTPDLVMEIVSPGDRRADIFAAETDYRNIGVPEIVFVDIKRKSVRLLRKRSATDPVADIEYDEIKMTGGETVTFHTLGITLETDWILLDPRPAVRPTLERLMKPVS